MVVGGVSLVAAAVGWPLINQFVKVPIQQFRCRFAGRRINLPQWVPLAQAIAYLAQESEWAARRNKIEEVDAESILEREFLERASRGELECRGIAYGRDFHSPRSASTTAIEPKFFETAFFQPYGELLRSDREPDKIRNVVATAGRYSVADPRRFADVTIKRASLIETWPPYSGRKKATAFSSAAEQYMKRSTANPDWSFDTWLALLSQHEPTTGRWRPLNFSEKH
jgi:hypothetical protein